MLSAIGDAAGGRPVRVPGKRATESGTPPGRAGGDRGGRRASIFAEQAGELDGLGVVVVAAGLERLLAVAGHGVRGQGDDRDALRSRGRP